MLSSTSAPLVSVVMSVYNCEKYIAESIESILSQTYTNFEFVIINDGSTDDTLKIIKKYNDPRIVLVSRENKGLVASLNEGISIAKGKYIARQDADDVSSVRRFEKQMKAMMKNDLAVCATYSRLINESGHLVSTYKTPYLKEDIARRLFLGNTFVHGSVIIDRSQVRGDLEYSATVGPVEDYELWSRLISLKIAVIPELLYNYRVNPKGISATQEDYQKDAANEIRDNLWRTVELPSLSPKALLGHVEVYSCDKEVMMQFIGDQRAIFEQAFSQRHYLKALRAIIDYSIVRLYERTHG